MCYIYLILTWFCLWDMRIYLIFDFDKRQRQVWSMGSGPNWYQIGNRIYEKLFVANFMYKKDIYVNRIKSVIFGLQMCILQNKTKCKGETEFWRSWNEKLDISIDRAWRVNENNGVIFPSYHVTPRVMVIKIKKKCSCFAFFANDSKILVTV